MYNTIIYVRLSKKNNIENYDTIENQINVIKEFIKIKKDLRIYSEKVDNGYSGLNFERPAFKSMMQEIKEKKANCIIVKDLSRFGRNYIEGQIYIEKIFPILGVRFISINDNFDSLDNNNLSNTIISFKNILNSAYLYDISIKIRSQLEIKRKNGDFTGPFVSYGYLKSLENKNKLIVDEYASKVVRYIFKSKLKGISQIKIAENLNSLNILSPMEYKRSIGINYNTSFKVKDKALWSPLAINRILKNEIYIGILEQGKRSTINYKFKTEYHNLGDKVIKIKNNHQHIISEEIFYIVNKLLLLDIKVSQVNKKTCLLSGFLFCNECKQSMIKKTVSNKNKKNVYYICSSNKHEKLKKLCNDCNINEKYVIEIIVCLLKNYIKQIVNFEEITKVINNIELNFSETNYIYSVISNKQNEIKTYKKIIFSLYHDLYKRIIDENDYYNFKINCIDKIHETEKDIENLNYILDDIKQNNISKEFFKEIFIIEKNIKNIDRSIISFFINKINVYSAKKIELNFNFKDEYVKISEI